MIVLQASHIAKHYDVHDVLIDANLVVQTGDRIALVGPNGAGKSTLLKIVVAEESPSEGEVSVAKGASIGYVSQFVQADDDATVFSYVAETFADLYKMERRLRQMEQDMANPDVYENSERFQELSSAYDSLQQRFTDANGYAVDARVRRVLDGLRFPKDMHGREVKSLSGGQKTRLSLARLLAWQPDLLVLDEPTNYLDTETIAWLENYLQAYEGALLLVSHDRYFLDKVVNLIYELENGKTTRYPGNYSEYLDEKAARYEGDVKRYEAQQKEIARMETFIQKNIVRATTTKRAQSRRKMLERMDRLEMPTMSTTAMALRFTSARESGKDVLRVADLQVEYPGKALPGPLNLNVARGQRIAILGPNGIGKSSFLKAIVGRLAAKTGSVWWGTHTDIGYYDQEQTDLHRDKTVLSEVWDDYPSLDMTTVRTALGRFLFRGDEVSKPVASLSGGERSRVALCKLMLAQANVLVMDEPTNHLDLFSKEVLEDSLQDYDGTLLFVSHDRYFIDNLATHVVTLDERGFRTFIGNYSDYAQKIEEEKKWNEARQGSDGSPPSATRGAPAAPTQTASPMQKPHIRSADLRKLREKVGTVEQRIADVEARQHDVAEAITAAAVAQEVEQSMKLQAELDRLSEEHTRLLAQWEKIAAELETMESALD